MAFVNFPEARVGVTAPDIMHFNPQETPVNLRKLFGHVMYVLVLGKIHARPGL